MPNSLIPVALLADIDQWRSMGERFSGQHLKLQVEDVVGFVVVVSLLAGIFLLMRWVSTWEFERKARPSPRRLLADLEKAHALSGAESRTIRLLAEAAGLESPALAYVHPAVFRGEAAERIGSEDDLRHLREKLFGPDPAPESGE